MMYRRPKSIKEITGHVLVYIYFIVSLKPKVKVDVIVVTILNMQLPNDMAECSKFANIIPLVYSQFD